MTTMPAGEGSQNDSVRSDSIGADRANEPPFISHPNERRCADCGRIVSLYRGRWADREPRDRAYQNAYHFTCREHISEKPDGTLYLEAADYHYVEGETQRRWEPPSVR